MITDKYFEDYTVGDVFISEEFSISEEEVLTYLKLVRDDHPIHFDRELTKLQFGRSEFLVPGTLTLALADGYCAKLVTPAIPYAPHYGQDKIRYVGKLFCDEVIPCEYKLIGKGRRNDVYGMLTFEIYVKKQNGDPVIYEIDKALVPYRNLKPNADVY